MRSLFLAFWQEEDGGNAIEYALIAALVAIAIVGGATALGSELNGVFTRLVTAIPGGQP